jgi:hypothetical protein
MGEHPANPALAGGGCFTYPRDRRDRKQDRWDLRIDGTEKKRTTEFSIRVVKFRKRKKLEQN